MKVYIDGENFRHQITHILVERGVLPKDERNNFYRFDTVGLLREIMQTDEPLDVRYYTTRIRQPEFKIPLRLSTKLDDISEANRRWVAQLHNQGIQVVKAGYLRVRESSACVHCGKKTLVLQEKGVDVRVATDVLLAAQTGDAVALVSSDSDIAPALDAARKIGGEVTYVCAANRVNTALAGLASHVVTFDPKKVLKYYKEQP